LDWGDERHAVYLQAAEGGPVERIVLEQKPDVLHAWVAQIRERFHGRPVGIAIEQRKGAVIHVLMMYECFVLYPINPKALARYREAFRTSGAKDDPADAALLLDLLRKHRDQLRPWVPDTVEARTLQSLCEQRRKLVNHRVALTNRLTGLLKQYFPQVLDWVGDLASRQGCDFLMKWPALAAVQRVRPPTLRTFYQQHNCRTATVIDERIRQIASACPLTSGPDHRPAQPVGADLRHATPWVTRRAGVRRASPRSLRATPIRRSLPVSPARVRCAPRAWRRPLAQIARGGSPPPSCNPIRASRP
jgi:hypothetical protein